MTDAADLPVVPLPGSEAWAGAYDWGDSLDKTFPGQDAQDFSYACSYNDSGPTADKRVLDLRMIVQGENEGADWIWMVRFETDRYEPEWWVMVAGCDYTGWDCQSSNCWTKIATP
jgi:hypothetical protein